MNSGSARFRTGGRPKADSESPKRRPLLPPDAFGARVRGEYLEMPGLRLTSDQARRLWRLDETACVAILGALVDAR